MSYVLKQDKIKLVLTTPLTSKSTINDHIVKHGDGVKVIALWVEDAKKAYEETTSRGACLLYTSPSPRDRTRSRMPSSA